MALDISLYKLPLGSCNTQCTVCQRNIGAQSGTAECSGDVVIKLRNIYINIAECTIKEFNQWWI